MTIFTFLIGIFFIYLIFVCPYNINNNGKSLRVKKSYINIFIFTVIIYLSFLYTFRMYKPGTDTNVYVSVFNLMCKEMSSIQDKKIASNMESGFRFFCYFISRITNNERVFLLLVSVCMYSSILYISKEIIKTNEIKSLFYSLLLFIITGNYFSSTNLMRQYLAVCIVLWGFYFYIKNKRWLFFLSVIFAATFHISSLVCFIIPFLKFIKINRKTLIIYFICLFIIYLFGIKILVFTVRLIIPRYEHYFTRSIYAIQSKAKLGSILNLIADFSLLILFLFNYDKNDAIYNFFIKIYMMTLVFTVFSLRFTQVGRVGAYFIISYLFLIPKCKKNALFYSVVVFLIVYTLMINCFRPEWTAFFPYSFCF